MQSAMQPEFSCILKTRSKCSHYCNATALQVFLSSEKHSSLSAQLCQLDPNDFNK